MKKAILLAAVFIITFSCSEESISQEVQKDTFLKKYGGTIWGEDGTGYEFTFNEDAPIIFWEGCGPNHLTPQDGDWYFEKNKLTELYYYNGAKYIRTYTIENNILRKQRTKNGEIQLDLQFNKTTKAKMCLD